MIAAVYLWANGRVMVFDEAGDQLPDFQGEATEERLDEIRRNSTPDTEWFGFDESGPLVWRSGPALWKK